MGYSGCCELRLGTPPLTQPVRFLLAVGHAPRCVHSERCLIVVAYNLVVFDARRTNEFLFVPCTDRARLQPPAKYSIKLDTAPRQH
jgi:hypothetical protein